MTPDQQAAAALNQGDAAEALRRLDPLLSSDPTVDRRKLAARALRSLGRNAEAAAHLRVAAEAEPGNGVVWHNLAAALGDDGQAAEAEAAARRAIALKDAPETWLVLGRALQAGGLGVEAEAAFEGAIRRRPDYAEALRALSQAVWMRTGEGERARAPVEWALAARPSAPLAALAAGVAAETGAPDAAAAVLAPWIGRGHAAIELAAATLAARSPGRGDEALTHAQAAVALDPSRAEARHALASALLVVGDTRAALTALEDWLRLQPLDQTALALQRTAWRLAGDPRALTPGDYDRLVRTYDLSPDEAAGPRDAWLTALAAALEALLPFRAEPYGQSIRSGVQSRIDPRRVGDTAIDQAFVRIEAALADYVATMDEAEPMGARRSARGGALIAGAWSVRLRAGGRHNDHVHPRGWVSSAFYVDLPEATRDAGRAGWLRFGAADLGAGLTLPAEHWVEPRPGRLVLFPSYLWHGTEPFEGDGRRLTLAFDALPAG